VFSHIKSGTKTIEGRCEHQYEAIKVGDEVEFRGRAETLKRKISRVNTFRDFAEMLQAVELEKCSPGIAKVDEGVTIYEQFYSK
jgi:ASC-1-like (ASCH) protein